jgi:hypothetical protein
MMMDNYSAPRSLPPMAPLPQYPSQYPSQGPHFLSQQLPILSSQPLVTPASSSDRTVSCIVPAPTQELMAMRTEMVSTIDSLRQEIRRISEGQIEIVKVLQSMREHQDQSAMTHLQGSVRSIQHKIDALTHAASMHSLSFTQSQTVAKTLSQTTTSTSLVQLISSSRKRPKLAEIAHIANESKDICASEDNDMDDDDDDLFAELVQESADRRSQQKKSLKGDIVEQKAPPKKKRKAPVKKSVTAVNPRNHELAQLDEYVLSQLADKHDLSLMTSRELQKAIKKHAGSLYNP